MQVDDVAIRKDLWNNLPVCVNKASLIHFDALLLSFGTDRGHNFE
jgi:hypothetical protein